MDPLRGWRSLSRKLPLLICGVLFAAVAAFAIVGYRQLTSALTRAAKERVRSASQLLARTFETQLGQMRADLVRFGADSAVRDFLRSADSRNGAAAAAALAEQIEKNSQVIGLEILGANGKRALWVDGLAAPKAPGFRDGHIRSTAPNGSVVGPIVAERDIIFYEIRVPLTNQAKATVGTLVEYRRLTGQGAQLIGGLIGADASLLLGDTSGQWTNLSTIVRGPRLLPNGPTVTSYAALDGSERLGAATPIRQTPWLVWVDIRTAAVLAPAQRFLTAMAIAAFLILLIGATAAWLISRQITAPLSEMVLVAQNMSTGDYSRRVRVERDDELGLLSEAFNSMAGKIEDSHRNLEEKVSERTKELAATVAILTGNASVKESEDRLRLIFDSVNDALFIADDGGKILDANPAARDLTGESIDQLRKRSIAEVLPESAPPTNGDGPSTRGKNGQAPTGAMRRSDERVLDIRSTAFAPGVRVYTVRDLTRQRKLEDQLAQAQKMEAVGQLAGGIAHDFNNLLTVIMSYSSLLLSDLGTDQAIREDIEEISDAAERAASLTRQLLAFSRKQVLQTQAVSLNTIVTDVEKMLRRLIGEDISLKTALDPSLPLITADPGQLEQVLINLAVNARDAMPNGGVLTIATASAQLSSEQGERHIGAQSGRYVMLAVTDTGSGMTKEVQQRLFEPFYTTKGPGKGTGLGLATVYGIVKQSGGDVYVYSELGHGTTFKVYFPEVATASAAMTVTAEHEARAPRGSETVLLAEDDEALRALSARVLGALGYKVLVARTGSDALKIVAEYGGDIDMIATDVVMPEMNGSQLVRYVLEARPEIAVLLMSGYTDDEVMRRGVLDGKTAFLQKPFTPDLLGHKVRQVLDRRVSQSTGAK
ncbi:MAG: ATP-binding protein [Gemmatimonadaceae bacterium]